MSETVEIETEASTETVTVETGNAVITVEPSSEPEATPPVEQSEVAAAMAVAVAADAVATAARAVDNAQQTVESEENEDQLWLAILQQFEMLSANISGANERLSGILEMLAPMAAQIQAQSEAIASLLSTLKPSLQEATAEPEAAKPNPSSGGGDARQDQRTSPAVAGSRPVRVF